MRLFLYNLGIWIYHSGIRLAAFWDQKAQLWVEGRSGWQAKMKSLLKPGQKRIWIHCASLGEFEQGRPVIEGLKKRYPQYKIVLTFYSPSGFEVRKDYEHADHVFYLPPDGLRNARLFLDLLQPQLAIFVKYEFWYHYIHQLHERQVPVFLIAAYFRLDQVFFKSYGGLFKSLLHEFTHIFVQDRESLLLLTKHQVQKVSIAPDTRVDRVYELRQNAPAYPKVAAFCKDKKVVIVGSAWEQETQFLLQFMTSLTKEQKAGLKFILAPHHIDRQQIKQLVGQKKSAIAHSNLTLNNASEKRLLVIDNVGMLQALYQYAYIAVIGGGFGKGIHNTLEPAAFGLPIIFGPHYQHFIEAREMVRAEGAFVVRDYEEFERQLRTLLQDQTAYQKAATATKDIIEKKRGGSQIILDHLKVYLD